MFLYHIPAPLIAAFVFIGIIICYTIGLKVLAYRKSRAEGYEAKGMGPLEGAVLGLLSLLLAFTFNHAASYHDTRREMVVKEANNIGTAVLRADLYPDSTRQAFRDDFKEYIITRIDYYEKGDDEASIKDYLQKANVISARIWNRAAGISRQGGETVRSMQMIPAINAMMDSVNEREEARNTRVPESILWLLFVLCFIGSFTVGYASGSKKTDWIIIFIYALMMVSTIYLILDLDRPRTGVINTWEVHEYMKHLLDLFK